MNNRLSAPLRRTGLGVLAVAAIFAATALPVSSRPHGAAQSSTMATTIPDVKCVIGCEEISPNTTGTVTATSKGLDFAAIKHTASISIGSITDIFVGQDSRQDVSGVGGTLVKAGIPYGGGRVLSLFSHKVEVLTIEYTDANGAFHGVILVFPPAHATSLKDQLVAAGAHVNTHVEVAAPPEEKP